MIFERVVDLPACIEACFAYHERPAALKRLIPPWESVTILRSDNSLTPGSEVLLNSRILGLSLRWLARHETLERPKLFVDKQVYGPFSSWRHEHRFEPLEGNRTQLIDHVEYQLPFGRLGNLLGHSFIKRKLNAMFAYRHRLTRQDLEFGNAVASASPDFAGPKTIAVSGSHGLIGSHVVSLLSVLGHHVIRLERPSTRDKFATKKEVNHFASATNRVTSTVWNPQLGLADPQLCDGIDAVIHLAGKGIADQRWTTATKADLVRSRVDATKLLSRQLSELPNPPKAFISASGVGIYGNRGEVELEESESANQDFLGQLAQRWEQAANPLADCGSRVCFGRLGIVLSPKGGALAKMLSLFRWALGGRMGSGKQYWSWIGHEDASSAFVWLALNSACHGPYNFVAGSMTNQDFTKCLATALSRPALLPVPDWALRTAMGEMADGLMLNSTRALGNRLQSSGYPMRQTDLLQAMQELLGVQPT